MTSACEATTRALPGAAVIELSGEVDGSAAAVLTDAYERAVAAGPDNQDTVVLDFAAVDYINSTGIALIVSVLARARAERRKVVASGLSPHYDSTPGCRTSSSSSRSRPRRQRAHPPGRLRQQPAEK
jgi:anti-anti-sigma factor